MSTEQIPEANQELGLFSMKNFGAVKANDDIASLSYTRHEQVPEVSGANTYNPEITDRQSMRYMPHTMLEVQFKIDKSEGGAIVEESDYTALASDGWSLFESASLSINGVQVRPGTVSNPAILSKLRCLCEDDQEYVDTVGQISHQYIDFKPQDGGATGLSIPTVPHVADTAPASTEYGGAGFYHEILTSKHGATGECFLTSAVKNPNYDKSFKAKCDRSTGVQTIYLPLVQVFNILDVMEVVQGTTLKVDLVKASRTKALFGALSNASFTISRVALWSCDVVPTISGRAKFNKKLKDIGMVEKLLFENYQSFIHQVASYAEAGEKSYQIGASINRPVKALVAFQKSARFNTTQLNPLVFDLPVDMTSVAMYIDGKAVPARTYSIPTDKFRILSDNYKTHSKLAEYSESSILTHDRWVDGHYPILCFDLAQFEATSFVSKSTSNLELRYTQASGATQSYNVHVVLVSHADLEMSYTDGTTVYRTS